MNHNKQEFSLEENSDTENPRLKEFFKYVFNFKQGFSYLKVITYNMQGRYFSGFTNIFQLKNAIQGRHSSAEN